MNATENKNAGEEVIRARIESELKSRFDKWCSSKKVSNSQVLRWIIDMQLEDPNRLWNWLSEKEKEGGE